MNDVTSVIHAAIDEVNETRAPDEQIAKAPGTVLIGDGGVLDSLGLVNLAVTAEDRLSERLGLAVPLSASVGAPPADSPFRTVGTLIAHVEAAVRGQGR